MKSRSATWFQAWAIIENRGSKLALFSGEVPIYWLRKVAQDRADQFNQGTNERWVNVEKVTIHRIEK